MNKYKVSITINLEVEANGYEDACFNSLVIAGRIDRDGICNKNYGIVKSVEVSRPEFKSENG